MYIYRYQVPFVKEIIRFDKEGISIKGKTSRDPDNRYIFKITKNQPSSRQTPTVKTTTITTCPLVPKTTPLPLTNQTLPLIGP